MSTVYIVGGGLAGLSAAVSLAERGARVVLYEAAGQAGGRCRSYFDATLDCVIDNGNHLVLSGNRAVRDYLRIIGAHDALAGPQRAEFAFIDLETGDRWTLSPNEGPLPWWIFSGGRRVPGTKAQDYTRLAALLTANSAQRIEDVIPCKGALWDRLMRPFLLAALNTTPEGASATLAGAVVRETLAKGGRAYRPRIAHPTLAAAFVDPALAFLAAKDGKVHFSQRLRRIVLDANHAVALEFPDSTVPLSADDTVVLATPPWVTRELVPKISAPDKFHAIVNGHFKIAAPAGAPLMLGVIGGTAEWIFAFPDRMSVTVSAADAIVDQDREALAALLWRDVAKAHNLSATLPPWQIVKEKRATFSATPEQVAMRPKTATAWRNLLLAGDWVDTGLPATIEGALRSGQKAAQLAWLRRNV
ncbi:MAG: hydroxysqualene dehydroxylase HpnE [Alphaproteobacteria bacterium]|nr:hydroxysqualene dehydroxylase HpnE [Alphaproteobacteria bacterium]MDE1986779.1 hydroxysqualene dehydroxylase HpnE [Alphaproteobacteria bacterium]MDE2162463.1 hydroxysqualene dehydroxylase HpnE [Alphaproteobacteria bacterium]MDE2499182.1 hydroxysqualene dehydroxylase HpnE [Alphaproteobacteria bacterium]